MTNVRYKTMTIVLVMVLTLTASIVMMSMPTAEAAPIKSTVAIEYYIHPGINSPNEFVFLPTPCVLFNPDTYTIRPEVMVGKDKALADAVITFTAPDGTKDVINGPFRVTPETALTGVITSIVQAGIGVATIYTPDQMGEWKVSFSWPGDSVYAATSYEGTFTVGEHTPLRPTFAFLSMRPYPAVGLGQELLVNAWVSPPPEIQKDTYQDYLFTITKPDGTVAYTIPFETSEMPGTVWFSLPLDVVGKWTIKFEFPGDWASLPCSVTRTITVQQEPIAIGYPDTPLPTEPWNFPINVQNREWRKIAGPWYQSYYNASQGSFNPYTEGVKSAHILWKLDSYGQLGGYIGSPHSIEVGSGIAVYGAGDTGIYGASVPNIRTIMAGRGYYTTGSNIVCVDMKTGKTLWTVPGTFTSGSERGSSAALYAFGSRFIAYDAITGAMTLNVTGMSANLFDPQLQLAYTFVSSANPLAGGSRWICWSTSGNQADFASRVVWNITSPRQVGIDGQWTDAAPHLIQSGILILQKSIDAKIIEGYIGVNMTTGAIVYNTTLPTLTDTSTYVYQQGPAQGSGYGMYYRNSVPLKNEALGTIAINASTGTLAWISEKTDYPWGLFYAYMPVASGHGLILALSYNGVYAMNATNGEIVWHYIDPDVYNEQPYGSNVAPDGSNYSSYSFGSTGAVIGGGVIYAPNTEHSPTLYYRGQGLVGIDAVTGQKLWKILGVYTPTAVAYGTLIASDSANGFTYAFSKGETATTVSTSEKVIAKGSAVLIEGTVFDQSPAQAGTAAVSEASMSAWMEYLHMQQPKPTNATGVAVKLTAVDANGNKIDVGIAQSDSTGLYSVLWTPQSEGKYTIIAEFEGSNSYYASSAETAVGVTPAPSASPSASVSPTTSATVPPISGGAADVSFYIAAAVVVVVIVAVAALLLRRRK